MCRVHRRPAGQRLLASLTNSRQRRATRRLVTNRRDQAPSDKMCRIVRAGLGFAVFVEIFRSPLLRSALLDAGLLHLDRPRDMR